MALSHVNMQPILTCCDFFSGRDPVQILPKDDNGKFSLHLKKLPSQGPTPLLLQSYTGNMWADTCSYYLKEVISFFDKP